jgi:ssDNA-binding Zn-finger/Zn-ribbon topoisomerase 1
MRRLRWLVGLALALGLGTGSAADRSPPAIAIGTPAEAVVREFGAPKSKLIRDDREVFGYPDFEVTFRQHRVTKVTLRRVAPSAIVKQAPAIVTELAPAAIATKQPMAQPARPVTPVSLLGVLAAMWPLYLILLMLVPTAEILHRLVKRHRRGKTVPKQVEPPPPPPSSAPPAAMLNTVTLTAGLLQRLEWQRFEELVRLYFTARGLRVDTPPPGTDPEVALCLYRETDTQPYAYVQCRTSVRREVEIKDIQRFFGIMVADHIDEGIVVTTALFSPDARRFAEDHGGTAINGLELIGYVQELDPAEQQHIVTQVTVGDYTTPTCPKCKVKLELRGEGIFWGCVNWPQCRTKIFVRRTR